MSRTGQRKTKKLIPAQSPKKKEIREKRKGTYTVCGYTTIRLIAQRLTFSQPLASLGRVHTQFLAASLHTHCGHRKFLFLLIFL
jgi:hypothetical protein